MDYIVRFYSNFTVDRCQPSHLVLIFRTMADIRDHILAQDMIYVGGGNTAAMLAIWRQHGVDQILHEAWDRGIVLCGASAGANCWFEACSTDSFGPSLAPLNDGLGFLAGSFCPHYDGEVNRRPTLGRFLDGRELPDGYACDNYSGLRFEGTQLAEAIASKDTARAYRVQLGAGGFQETEIVARYLGAAT